MPDLRGLFNDLIRFEIDLWNAVDARLKSEFGLPLTHFEPMSVMDRIAGCRVYDIANELGITTGGTSKLVDRIEASGYCRRLPNPDDRRSSLLELTEAGRRLFAKAGVAFDDELQRRLGAALPERTLRQFASTLARLRIASRHLGMEETPPGSPARLGPHQARRLHYVPFGQKRLLIFRTGRGSGCRSERRATPAALGTAHIGL
jgi:DNA-binding MarR family transcriptional regulator